MYYGEGAGNRRKLIKATVKQRSKDPLYKMAFNEKLANTDLAEESSKAKSERHRTDAKNKTVKTTRGVINTIRGNGAYAGALAYIKNKPAVDSFIKKSFSKTVSKMHYANEAKKAQEFFNKNGI